MQLTLTSLSASRGVLNPHVRTWVQKHARSLYCMYVFLYTYLESQVAGNNRPLYHKVDHYWLKVAYKYEPLALQVVSKSFGN